jgi:hypothetical protein
MSRQAKADGDWRPALHGLPSPINAIPSLRLSFSRTGVRASGQFYRAALGPSLDNRV